MKKPAPAPIHSLLAERWSPRAFDAAAVLSETDMTAMAEAARWAPSCYGAEPWAFVFCNRASDSAAWEKALECLAPPNQAWARNASLLVLACAQSRFARNGKPNRHCGYDAGAAVFSLVLQAEAAGWRCHQMGGFDADKARAAFAVPEEFECMAFVAAGRQTAAATLPDDLRAREEAGRKRRGLGENFFRGKWGRGLES